MSKKNDGGEAEKLFTETFESHRAFVYKFVDAKAARNRNIKAVPADFLVAEEGHLFLAEVKSTANKESFPFSMITRMEKMVATLFYKLGIGAHYMFYVFNTETKTWYMFSAAQFCNSKKKSIRWSEMAIWETGHK